MKNTSDFRQSITLNGKRVLLHPDDVIESERELKYIFLERVPDDTPITIKAAGRVTSIASLQEKLKEIEADKMNATVAGKEELDAVSASLSEVKSEIERKAQEKASELTTPLAEQIDSVETNLASVLERFEAHEALVMRRLDMIKSAIMTMQEDLYNVEFDADGRAQKKEEPKSA